MTKRKDTGMDLTSSPDEASGGPLPQAAHTLPSGLKPQLDLIFSEVEQKLPDIDFDFSDVDSDTDEPVIFHQQLKSLSLEEDKDLDTSQGDDQPLLTAPFTSLDSSKLDLKETDEDKNKNSSPTGTSVNLYDNDLAYELQQSGINIDINDVEVSSWTDIASDSNRNADITAPHSTDTEPSSSPQTKSQGTTESAEKSVSWSDISQEKREMTVSSWGEIPVPRRQTASGVDSNRATEEPDTAGLSLNSLDDKVIRKQLDRQKARSKEKDIATNMVSPRGPVLSTQILDNINLDTLLQSLSSDNQYAPPPPRPAWAGKVVDTVSRTIDRHRRSPRGDEKPSDSTTLIQKLAQMSMDSYGEDLTDIDPTTGASKTNQVPDNDRQAAQGHGRDDDVDRVSTTVVPPTLISTSQLARMEKALTTSIMGFLDPAAAGDKNQARQPVSGSRSGEVKSSVAAVKPALPAVKKSVSSSGTNNSDFKEYTITARPSASATKPETKPETAKIGAGNKEPTVFIDLRNFDQVRQEQQHNIQRVQKVLGINPGESQRVVSDSDSDDEDWREQRRQFKQQVARGKRPHTAPIKSKPPTGSCPQPTRVINMADLPPRLQPRQPETSQTTPAEGDGGAAAQKTTEEERQQQAQDRERERQIEAIRKLREQRENELKAKHRLQKRLEALRPSASVGGRQDAAENIPTVFDIEASYEPAPHNLPPALSPDQDTLLLTIHLSSDGEIVLHRGSGNKSVDTGTGLSASYTTLLTWLLALVPDNFTYLQEGGARGSSPAQVSPWILPFYVVGLQQALMDDQLFLMVTVTPVEQFDAKYVPVKSKKGKKTESKGTAAFLQHLTKYFSVNTLHSVCPWLQNMVSMEVAPPANEDEQESQKPGYVYKPPLPNITTKPLSTFIQINPDRQAASKVFNSQVGFFWQTVDSEEARADQNLHDTEVNYDTQNTVSLIYKKIYRDPSAVMGILNRVLQLGLDLGGVRLVYPTPELMNLPKTDNASALSELDLLNNVGAVLALCIRGHAARSIWLDAIGPSDPALARKTDPNSLCALYGGESRDECLLFCPRTPARVQTELVRWFGGRVPPGNVIDVGQPYTKKDSLRSGSPKGKRTKKVTFSENAVGDVKTNDLKVSEYHRPLATLTATTKSEIFLALSPLVPPKCFGLIMASCQRRGFQVTGVRRCRLTSKKAAALGISGEGVKTFCPGSPTQASVPDHTAGSESARLAEALFPSTILLLQKENACHSAASLIEDGMVQLTLNGIMGTIQGRVGFPLGSQHMLHAGRFSDSLLVALGGDFNKCYDPEIQINPSYVIPKLYTNPECEQITVLMLLGHDILKSSGLFVGKLLNIVPYSRATPVLPFTEGLELLGMKWLPCLTNAQAKEVTPCEVGDRLWKDSLHTLTSEPCLALALRSVDIFKCLEKVVQPRVRLNKEGQPYHFDTLHARTPEEAYTLIRLFFTERELFSDPLARPLAPYFPPHVSGHQADKKLSMPGAHTFPAEESVFDVMLAGPRPFTTFLVVKPRAVQKHLTKFLKKLTQEGFKIVALKLQVLSEEQAARVIPTDTQAEQRQKHLDYLRSGSSLCLAVQRENAVKKLLDALGPDDPQSARRLSQFYWRGVFGADCVCNGLYASLDYQQSVADQKFFFPDGLCCEETEITLEEEICCPAEDKEMYVQYSAIRNVVEQTTQATDSMEDSHRLLTQTTCIVLPPMLMKKLGAHFAFVDVIEGLVSQGFEFVGGRMVWFSQDQAKHFLCTIDAGNFQKVPMLTSGGSIVLALQRDNAVLAFDSILRETFSTESCQGKTVTDSILHKYGPLILRPSDIKQAHKLLGFFFDQLLPSSQVQILPRLE